MRAGESMFPKFHIVRETIGHTQVGVLLYTVKHLYLAGIFDTIGGKNKNHLKISP